MSEIWFFQGNCSGENNFSVLFLFFHFSRAFIIECLLAYNSFTITLYKISQMKSTFFRNFILNSPFLAKNVRFHEVQKQLLLLNFSAIQFSLSWMHKSFQKGHIIRAQQNIVGCDYIPIMKQTLWQKLLLMIELNTLMTQ